MTATLTLQDNGSWLDQEQDILPIMTAIFVEGLETGPQCTDGVASTIGIESERIPGSRIFRFPLPKTGVRSLKALHAKDSGDEQRETGNFSSRFNVQNTDSIVARNLIRGISHHFNNLLMGIWGNASLIRLQLRKDDSRYARVEQMEHLLQSGAFLIHMVLGFLGERRTVAKRIRLNQLISEMKCEGYATEGEEDPWNFEARLKWASRVQRPRLIAGSTARVLEVLFRSVGKHCCAIVSPNGDDLRLQRRLSTITTLVDRGLDIVNQLRMYAGDFANITKKQVKIELVIGRLLGTVEKRYPKITTRYQVGTNLPSVNVNQWQLEWAIKELVENAARAMPGGGHLKISVRTLQQESPQERCGVQKGGNYLVITVQDSGHGIADNDRKCVFQPFFPSRKHHDRIGLGLAVCDGILKSHSGYIHLQIRNGMPAATFKLYLPFEGAALLDQTAERAGDVHTPGCHVAEIEYLPYVTLIK